MPKKRWLRYLAGALALVALGAFIMFQYIRARGNKLLQEAGEAWLAQRIATLSDSVYRVRLMHLRYQPASRSFLFDSLLLSTDVVRNQARAVPFPTLTLAVYGGRVAGIDPWEALRGMRVHAGEVGFDSVRTVVVLPTIYKDTTAKDTAKAAVTDTSSSRKSLFVIGDVPGAVPGEPLAIVDQVHFGGMNGRLVLPLDGEPQEIELNGLTLDLDGVSFDPRKEATTPFHLHDVQLASGPFDGDLGKNDRLSFKRLAGSFRDSTFQVDGIRLAPRGGDSGYVARRKYRGSRLMVGADSVRVSGMDWDGLLQGTHVGVRRIELDGFELDLLSDKRLPPNPGPKKPRPYPQQRVAALRGPLAIDTVVLHRSRVQYAERAATADRPGRLRFEDIEATIVNATNDPRRQTDSTPLRLTATTNFMGAGRLEALIEFPLLAPTFEARYRARLGRMDAKALNEMIQPLVGAAVKEGEFTSLLLDARVHNGVYSGTLVPQYRGLGVTIPQSAQEKKKEHGVGGFFKGIKRGAMAMAANTVVRTNNPAKPGKPPETGRVSHVRRPWESFWAGIWQSLKPALKESLVNVDF
jgi:hypothetical protein